MSRQLDLEFETWRMPPLKIAGHVMTDPQALVATVIQDGHRGRGETIGVFYHGETTIGMAAQIERVRADIEAGISREELRAALPPGGARCAIDCALWDLEAARAGRPVWALAGLRSPVPRVTTYTLGADTPLAMADVAAGRYASARALKLKLLGDGADAERVRAVRAARRDVWLGVDANCSLTRETYAALSPALVEARVDLLEQPFHVGEEALMDGLDRPIPVAADESVQDLDDLDAAVGRFNMINIKLDKCGGLTEALLIAARARELGLGLMVGNMGGTSLGMAPALVVGQLCNVVDLDGPLFLERDRKPSLIYAGGLVSAPAGLWGDGQ